MKRLYGSATTVRVSNYQTKNHFTATNANLTFAKIALTMSRIGFLNTLFICIHSDEMWQWTGFAMSVKWKEITPLLGLVLPVISTPALDATGGCPRVIIS